MDSYCFENALSIPILRGKGTVPFCCAILLIFIAGSGCSREPRRKSPERQPASSETAAPGKDARSVIVAFGDSLTAGLGVDPSENYPGRLQRRIDAEGLQYRIVNAGISGDTSAQGLNRIESVLTENPRIVILCLGANDGLRGYPVDATRKNLDAIVGKLLDEGVKVVLAGVVMPPNYGPFFTREFRKIFPELAGKHRIPLVPFLLEGVAGIPELNLPDGIHPNSEGYERVAENVWSVLEPLL